MGQTTKGSDKEMHVLLFLKYLPARVNDFDNLSKDGTKLHIHCLYNHWSSLL